MEIHKPEHATAQICFYICETAGTYCNNSMKHRLLGEAPRIMELYSLFGITYPVKHEIKK